jgi:hypothetical protein
MINPYAAVRSRRAADVAAPLAGGVTSSSTCHLGNISLRTGRPASRKSATRGLKNAPQTKK